MRISLPESGRRSPASSPFLETVVRQTWPDRNGARSKRLIARRLGNDCRWQLAERSISLSRPTSGVMYKAAAFLLSVFLLHGQPALGMQRVTAVGMVQDGDGKPIEHAAVLVYSARVRRGFSVFCPTCYVDCGKRAFTGSDGKYSIAGLDPDLVFNLLVVRGGYSAKLVKKVDPQQGPAEIAVLKRRIPPENPSQIIRGRVLDSKGTPVRDALVEQEGAVFPSSRAFGDIGWIDLLAVTNDSGDFEVAHSKPLVAAIVRISPRAMAAKLSTIPSGVGRKVIVVTEGATIRGRLVRNGEPIVQAEIGLSTHSRASGETLPEIRIGTDDDGRFALTNIPPDRIWYLYARMESLAPRGLAAEIVECATKSAGQDLNLGDISVRPAYALHGKIVLVDGKPIPADVRINLFSDRVPDSQSLILAPNGVFEFKGLGRGVYHLAPSVRGYEARDPESLELLIDRDVTDFEALLQPEVTTKR